MTEVKLNKPSEHGCLRFFLVALIVFFFITSVHINYGLRGRIIDDQTREGISGVVVVRVWQKDVGIIADGLTRVLAVEEVLSDEDGYFKFGWKFLFSPGIFPFAMIYEHGLYATKEGFGRRYLAKEPGYKYSKLPKIELREVDCSYSVAKSYWYDVFKKNLPLLQAEYNKVAAYYEELCSDEVKLKELPHEPSSHTIKSKNSLPNRRSQYIANKGYHGSGKGGSAIRLNNENE